jgi:alginate O-acetyltransferase complex protein AlgI
MLFNSIEYFLFLPIVFSVYWMLSGKKTTHRNFFFLVSSYTFYAWWDWRLLSLIIISTLTDYWIGQRIFASSIERERKQLLRISLVVNLGLLAIFKYFNFFLESWNELWHTLGFNQALPHMDIILPVGISFYTFQTLSYSIDVYRRKMEPTNNILNFAVFVSFFPQLVAGPIERAKNLLPQISSLRMFSFLKFKEGLIQILVGLVKKMLIADTISIYVDSIYAHVGSHNSPTLLIATYLYAIQIYCDFSGYSDIAIGTAKLFNISFMDNFNRPYISKSLTEFWRRWHISLSSWLKDYLYISLGGNRKGKFLTYRNLLITMLLGGLWHGSSWNYVIWGFLHGFMLALEKMFDLKIDVKGKYLKVLRVILTFNLVCLTWIFFRAHGIEQALDIISTIFKFDLSGGIYINNINTIAHIVLAVLLFIGLSISFDSPGRYKQFTEKYSDFAVGLIISLSTIMLVLFYQGNNNAFIYFQF